METAASADHPDTTSSSVVALEERAWLGRHCGGDPLAFAQLLGAYRGPVYNYLLRSGVAESARDDLFQETFLRIHSSAASYQPARPLTPWIFTIVANLVRNHFRSTKRQPEKAAEEELCRLPDPRADVPQQLENEELTVWLAEAIPALPLPQREVISLVLIQGLSQRDVAVILAMPVNSVKTHLRRARLSLVVALQRWEASNALEGERHVDL